MYPVSDSSLNLSLELSSCWDMGCSFFQSLCYHFSFLGRFCEYKRWFSNLGKCHLLYSVLENSKLITFLISILRQIN